MNETTKKIEQNVTVSEIASALELTERRVQQLSNDGILPKSSRGAYNLIDCIKAYEKFLNNNVGNDDNKNITALKCRLLSAKAAKAELELAISKKEYVKLEEIEAEYDNMVINFRNKMLSIPNKLVMPIVAAGGQHAKIAEILETEIYDALTELSKGDYSQIKD